MNPYYLWVLLPRKQKPTVNFNFNGLGTNSWIWGEFDTEALLTCGLRFYWIEGGKQHSTDIPFQNPKVEQVSFLKFIPLF